MQLTLLSVVIMALTGQALAQSSTPSPTPTSVPASSSTIPHSITSSFRSSLRSYYGSILDSQKFTNIAGELYVQLPANVLNSLTANINELLPVPTTGPYNLYAIATDPQLTFTTPAWSSDVSPSLVDAVLALETSAAIQIAKIGQHVLGISASIQTPKPTSGNNNGNGAAASSGGAAGLLALLGVGVGAAAVLL